VVDFETEFLCFGDLISFLWSYWFGDVGTGEGEGVV